MDKKGGILLIVGIVFLILLLVVVGAIIYFYNFHVFKSVLLCTGEASNTKIPCGVTQECLILAEENGLIAELGDVPAFIQEGFDRVVADAVYCNNTCFVKNVRGINYETQELEMLDGCLNSETPFVFEIRGKEGLEVLKWLKSRKDIT
jgi:hypothetical protein